MDGPCSVDDCERPAKKRGWCLRHWHRWRRHGDPTAGTALRIADPLQRLMSRVDKTDTCWLWTGPVNNKGYGMASFQGKKQLAHRIAYQLIAGDIPEGLQLDHLCRVVRCVRPDHLEPVTPAENMRRMGVARTHCVHGHLYTPDTTYLARDGRRRCRACARLRDQARRSRTKSERNAT